MRRQCIPGRFFSLPPNGLGTRLLKNIPADLKDTSATQCLPSADDEYMYTKTLGIEWNTAKDHFRFTIAKLPPLHNVTKRVLVSDIAKTFDVLGFFSPAVIKVKILLQKLWEQRIDWDDQVPPPIYDDWLQWRSELPLLADKHLPRCYFDKGLQIVDKQLHGFSDASENAYTAVVYLRMVDTFGKIQISFVAAKTKVAPIKRLTIPRLELCGAYLLAQLLSHVKGVLQLPLRNVHAWTDSTIVLNWLTGNPRRFKTYVGNRVSSVVELIPPDRWNHVEGIENPSDCASRGLFPSELLDHPLWWNGPPWLRQDASQWPKQVSITPLDNTDEERELSFHTTTSSISPVLKIGNFSSFTRLKRVTAWVFRFIHNCRCRKLQIEPIHEAHLTTKELHKAEVHWYLDAQVVHFAKSIAALRSESSLPKASPLLFYDRSLIPPDYYVLLVDNNTPPCRSFKNIQSSYITSTH